LIDAQRVDYVALMSRDLERSKRFYGETLGLRRNPLSHDDWPEFETGNVTLLLVDPGRIQTEFSPSKGGIGLRVPDVDAAMKRLQEAGVEFLLDEVYDSSVCHMAFFDDPDGNRLVLHRRYAPYSDGSLP
jgi:catechol 2,3-dioxygenase-like lactoylglutathione lyase family enzyme